MEIAKLKADIQTGNIKHFYIFTGEELEVQRIYIQHVAERTRTLVERFDTLDSILDSLKRKTLLKRNRCVLIRDDKSFMQDEKLWTAINDFLEDDILILLYTNIDKRTKFYKYFKDLIVDFEPLPEQLLVKYIKKNINLSQNKCSKLIDICESSYGRILLEIDKIKQYRKALDLTRDDEMTDEYFFDKLIQDGTIYQPPKDAIFDFVDAVLRRQSVRAFELLAQCYAVGEATMVLLSVLYTNVKQMLQVQSYDGNNIEKGTGLTAWQIKCAREKIGKYRIGELVEMLRLIQSVEQGIKQGTIDDNVAVEYILVKIL